MITPNILSRYTAQVIYVATFPWSSLSRQLLIAPIASTTAKKLANTNLDSFRTQSFHSSISSRLPSPAFVENRPSLPSSSIFGISLNNSGFTKPLSSTASSIKSNQFKMSSSSTNDDNSDENKANNNRVALLQFEVSHDKSKNLQTAREYITRAHESGAYLCVLPEIWNSPYATSAFGDYSEILPGVGDVLADEDGASKGGWGPSPVMLMEMAKSTGMYIVGGSVPESCSGKIYNTCLVINPSGEIVVKHRKVHLFDVDVPGGIRFKESETLSAGGGVTFFDVEGLGRIGVGICYDIRFPEYALLLTQIHKCKILIYPGAFNLTTGPAHWELLQRARAVDGQCYVLTASPARSAPPPDDDDSDTAKNGDGTEQIETKKKYPHYSAWGHSTAVSPWGEVIATCEEGPAVVIADLDMDKVEEMRMAIPTTAQKRKDLYDLVDGRGNQ
mmetsp:Transcript_22356/g.46482  ORF Transcript_22356/g.46482 Transcript_22356/m.46482 type:complete len:445 (+) Transcript_22356:215-1549(+)|eukprot:CAMPEP_0171330834 /NCGR_PEP_ID=MMETSP0878-20121228/2272_1 /TAXON_ID=67004 /ORGANISM="Thalassiosira weissflogii, Strain CCMP1336" /LENGTH=444 /DNA_ID=CAMNT_0011831217 /DNA_START=113 /DNA_END=1447 /DNA_ORIENTATION=-